MRHSGLALVCVLATFSGCIFSPPQGKGKIVIPPKYDVPASPELVLSNMVKAYTAKDSTAYKACFDDLHYFGTSVDQTGGQAVPESLYFANEAQHISALARSAADVHLQLTPSIVRSRDTGDPPGWALIQNPVYNLTIDDGSTEYVITGASETIEFRFVPKTPDTSSQTDTTWQIIRWTEIR